MRTANWAAAVDYINQNFSAGCRDVDGIASLGTLRSNQPGLIEFKVRRYAFGGRLNTLVANVIAVHGRQFKDRSDDTATHYEWTLTPERSVVVGQRKTGGPNAGIYIQLKDTGS